MAKMPWFKGWIMEDTLAGKYVTHIFPPSDLRMFSVGYNGMMCKRNTTFSNRPSDLNCSPTCNTKVPPNHVLKMDKIPPGFLT
jgi:hypothetical protein